MVRLNWDGSVDQTFNIGSGPTSNITDMNVTENDNIVLTGYFIQFNGVDARRLIKLSNNGQVIQSFTDNFNSTFPDDYSISGSPFKSFRDGFVGCSVGPLSYNLSFVNAEGTFNPDTKLPNEITKVWNNIIPIVADSNTIFIVSKFTLKDQQDPSFVLRLIFNDKPIITGTTTTLSTPEETPLELTLDDLLVTDADSNFPDDFTFIIHEGENYSVDSSFIIPDIGFVGNLTVPVTVSDGNHESDIFNLGIEVTAIIRNPISVTISGDSTKTNDPLVGITFSETVYGFQPADINITNGVISGLLTEDSLTFTTLVAPIADGKVALEIPVGVAYNEVGTTNQASNIFAFEYDGTSPTVKLSSSESDTSSTVPFSVAIKFSELVTGFSSSNIQISNATLSELVTTDSTNFIVQIIPNAFGEISVEIPSDAAQDQAGNGSEASQKLHLYYQQPYFTLAIKVNTPNQMIYTATATLYKKAEGQLTIMAVLEISDSLSLSFEELPEGEYTVGNLYY